jgi:hypothetical protein
LSDNWLDEYLQDPDDPKLAPADQTRVKTLPEALREQQTIGSVGPARRGNLPLPRGNPELQLQGRRRDRVKPIMDLIADVLPIIGEGRGVVAGHELAQQGTRSRAPWWRRRR